ncbi:MAG: amidohydrolase [Firmicutes bacterium]|nr:amidohydrolase [Bacillota bacterium]
MSILIKNTTIVNPKKENSVRKNKDILISQDKIAQISNTNEDNAAKNKAKRTIDGQRLLILPGLINSHAHTYMGYFRNYGAGLSLHDWLFQKIFPAEARLTFEDCQWSTAFGLMEMLRSGITGVNDMHLIPASAMEPILESKMRVAMGFSIFINSFNPPSCEIVTSNLENAYKKYHKANSGLVKILATVHSGYLYPPKELEEGAAWLKAKGYGIHTHLHETKKEVEDDLNSFGLRPIERFAEMGLLGPKTVAAHCIHLNDKDRKLLRESQTLAVPCPTSNLRLAAGFFNLPKMKEQKVKFALGTDGQSSGNGMNIWKEMHLASLLSAALEEDPGALQDYEVLQAVTQTPAQAIFAQEDEVLGMVVEGAQADLIGINIDAPHFYALNDPLSAAVHQTISSDVVLAMVNGQILMEKGEFNFFDEERILYEIEQRSPRLTEGL